MMFILHVDTFNTCSQIIKMADSKMTVIFKMIQQKIFIIKTMITTIVRTLYLTDDICCRVYTLFDRMSE